ncbi:uncharacterized protein LOC100215169 [Hydra vulgaris]|uniref:uncharacterized protein LOC100215169 n=1 Tax=Hydra vulgaris TaxID=6087 RepID=UPI0001924D13|nr:uncharacterized protein LOC100215169 isoform X1 [Hydra vulgaris]
MNVVLLILYVYVKSCSPTFHCNADWCDPSHEPYPNIVSTMTGYNILKGNPFTTTQTSDPGFSSGYIFVPTYRTEDGTYALHDGVTVRQTLQCSLTSSTDVITTLNSYVNKIQKKSSYGRTFTSNLEYEVKLEAKMGDVGAEVSTTIPPLIESSFSSSNEYRDNKDFFTKKKGVLALRDATCATYTVRISPYKPPPFSEGFKIALQSLNDSIGKSTEEIKESFNDFIREFGTHFLQQTTMGARTAITRRYSGEEFRQSRDDSIQKCNEDRLKVTIAGVGVGSTSESCNSIDLTTNSNTVAGFERESITSYGSKPAKNLEEWAQQKFESPLPIKMKLSPILNLFSKRYMKLTPEIRYKAILSWFEPLYKSYCETNKASLGIEECSTKEKNKCGYDDNCIPRQQVCNSDGNSYTCCTLKCDAQPCKNGGVCHDITDNSCTFRCDCADGWEGSTCESKVADFEKISSEIEAQMQKFQSLNNDNFRKELYSYLERNYNTYKFVVNSYNEIDGDDTEAHSVVGNYVHFYKKYGRNLVVAWAKTGFPNHEDIPELTASLYHSVYNYDSNAKKSVLKAWNDHYAKYKDQNPIVFMQVVRHGNGLRSNHDTNFGVYFDYKVSYWNREDVSSFIALYGKM